MGLRGNNFHQAVKVVQAINPQDINNTTISGTWIVNPWTIGGTLSFVLLGGIIAATGAGVVTFEGRKRSDGSAVQLLNAAGTGLAIPAARLADAGAIEGSFLVASLPLDDVDSDTYDAVRIKWQNTAAVSYLAAAVGIISGLYNTPSGMVDETFGLIHAS